MNKLLTFVQVNSNISPSATLSGVLQDTVIIILTHTACGGTHTHEQTHQILDTLHVQDKSMKLQW
jgi:hypothetical protein